MVKNGEGIYFVLKKTYRKSNFIWEFLAEHNPPNGFTKGANSQNWLHYGSKIPILASLWEQKPENGFTYEQKSSIYGEFTSLVSNNFLISISQE